MRPLLAAVVLALVLTGPAQARERHPMTFNYAAMVAVDYWAKRNVTLPCHPTYRVMTEAESEAKDLEYGRPILALGEQTTCLVTLSWRIEQYRANRDMYYPSYELIYCEVIIHEFGHIAGLSHAYGGVMSEDGLVEPWGCSHREAFMRLHGGRASRASRGSEVWRRAVRLDRRCRSQARTDRCGRT